MEKGEKSVKRAITHFMHLKVGILYPMESEMRDTNKMDQIAEGHWTMIVISLISLKPRLTNYHESHLKLVPSTCPS